MKELFKKVKTGVKKFMDDSKKKVVEVGTIVLSSSRNMRIAGVLIATAGLGIGGGLILASLI